METNLFFFEENVKWRKTGPHFGGKCLRRRYYVIMGYNIVHV